MSTRFPLLSPSVFGKNNSSEHETAKSDLNQESQLGSLLIDVIRSVLLQIIIRPNFPLLLVDGERETKHPALVLVVVHSCCHAKSCMQLRVCVYDKSQNTIFFPTGTGEGNARLRNNFSASY
jgi:hypothetical protein